MQKVAYLGAVALLALTASSVRAESTDASSPTGGAPPSVATYPDVPLFGVLVQQPSGQPNPQQQPSGQPNPQPTPSAQPQTPAPAAAPAQAPSSQPRQGMITCPTTGQNFAGTVDADVVLDIPNLSVDQITLSVEQLHALVNLDARLANLLQLTAGVDASLGRVNLDIRGVCAEAHLVVRLNNVAAIIDRVATTIDRNPAILTNLTGSVGQTLTNVTQPGGLGSQLVGTVGQTLNNVTQPGGLLTQTVNTLGQTVQRTIDTTGNILEQTLDTTGNLLSSQTVGSLLNLPVLSTTTNAAGQTVRRVTDTSGAVIELTLDQAGNLLNSQVVQQATGGQP